jgi:hypothetical protein
MENGNMSMLLQGFIANLVQKFSGLIDTLSLEPNQISSHDRYILEKVILPSFAKEASVHNVLFVGCAAYTRRYEEILPMKEYWTIDVKRVKRKYGSKRHIVDSITNIGKHVANDYFQLILMNGVIGFGLNRLDEIDQAINACHTALASDGILVLGWNNTALRTPIDLRTVQALAKFQDYYFEPLRASLYQTQVSGQHTYGFYQKR